MLDYMKDLNTKHNPYTTQYYTENQLEKSYRFSVGTTIFALNLYQQNHTIINTRLYLKDNNNCRFFQDNSN